MTDDGGEMRTGDGGVTGRTAGKGVFEPSVLHSANLALYAKLTQRAKEMRANPTPAEAAFWEQLRNKKLGIKFRQQHVIDRFIADFCSIEGRLIIEVDGDIHDQQKIEDEHRTHILEFYGYNVIRFRNEEVLEQTEKVVTAISSLLKSPTGDLGAENLTTVTLDAMDTSPDSLSKSPLGDLGAQDLGTVDFVPINTGTLGISRR